MSHTNTHSQQGIAIIMALLIVAILAILATQMMQQSAREIYRARLMLHHAKITQYTEGARYWAKDQLTHPTDHTAHALFIRSPIAQEGPDNIVSVIYTIPVQYERISNTLMTAQTHLLLQMLLTLIPPTTADSEQFLLETVITLPPQSYRRYALLERKIFQQHFIVNTVWYD